MNSEPTISVITICFNNPGDLKRTCESVDKQTLSPFEHIIVNGSTSKDIENWAETEEQPGYRKFIHERDKGISDAFNKGILASRGAVIVLLNSADTFADEQVLALATKTFQTHPGIAWLHGKYRFQRGGVWITLGKPHDPALIYRGMRAICHQTMFVRRALYDRYGLYDTDLKLAMDFDFLVRIRKEPFLFLNELMVVFAPGGASAVNVRKGLDENTHSIKKYLGFSWKHYLWKLRILILSTLLNSRLGKLLYRVKVWLKLENA